MRPESDVQRVFELWEQGLSKKAIARETGVSRAQVRAWIGQGLDNVLGSPMRSGRVGNPGPCDGSCGLPAKINAPAYAYLFG